MPFNRNEALSISLVSQAAGAVDFELSERQKGKTKKKREQKIMNDFSNSETGETRACYAFRQELNSIFTCGASCVRQFALPSALELGRKMYC